MIQVTFSKDYVSSSLIFLILLLHWYMLTYKTESQKFLSFSTSPQSLHFFTDISFLYIYYMWHFWEAINTVFKISSSKSRNIYIHCSCNIVFVKLCGKRISRLPYRRCTKYLCSWGSFLFFFLDSRLAKYVPVHTYSNTKVYPCGWVRNIYW